jgi:hypothetical protein
MEREFQEHPGIGEKAVTELTATLNTCKYLVYAWGAYLSTREFARVSGVSRGGRSWGSLLGLLGEGCTLSLNRLRVLISWMLVFGICIRGLCLGEVFQGSS